MGTQHGRSVSSSTSIGPTASIGSGGMLSIPLIPHEVHRRRRLLEIMSSATTSWNPFPTNTAAYNATATSPTRPSLPQSPFILGYDRELRPRRYPRQRRRRRLSATEVDSQRQPQVITKDIHSHRDHPHEKLQVLSLYQGFGTHYADVWVGSPPQRQTLIVDTGSATTAFACSGCSPRRCGRLDRYHTDPLFSERHSSTFRKLHCDECFLGACIAERNECQFGVAYQEGSNWTAYEAVDRCYVGGLHTRPLSSASTTNNNQSQPLLRDGLDPHGAAMDYSFDLRFGCQTQMTGPFRTQMADGIMGMDIGKPAIWNQMYLQDTIATRAFSLCFSRQTNARRSGTQAGAMTFGGTDQRLHAPNHVMVYSATNFDGAGFFSVQLHQVYLRHGRGGHSVVAQDPNALVLPLNVAENLMNHGEIIIDSGTTDTYFVHHLREPFHKAWKEIVGTAYTNDPIALTDEELNHLPTVILQFKGHDSNTDIVDSNTLEKELPLAAMLDPEHPIDVLLAIPPSHYMEYQAAKGMYVPGIYFEEADGSVLGANVMMLHDILFDVEQGRIGWVESQCDYAKLAAPFMPDATSSGKSTTINKAVESESKGRAKLRARAHTGVVNSAEAAVAIEDQAGYPNPQHGFCMSFECHLSVAMTAVVACLAVVAVLSRKRKRARKSRTLSLNATPASAINSTSTATKLMIYPAPSSGPFYRPASPSGSDSDSPPVAAQERRGAVLRSRSYKPTSLSLSDGESPFPVRSKGFSRKSVLRSRSTQVII